MNQPQTEKQTGKRIVSKGAYLKAQSKAIWGWFAVAYGFGICVFLVGFVLWAWHRKFSVLSGILGCFLFGMAVLAYNVGRWSLNQVRALEPVVPLTRANTADLPAPDTLVRASAEPRQEPQSVLLRAATEGVERHEEQLVRASVGTEQP